MRAVVTVPKAAVNEYDGAAARKNDIRCAREFSCVQPKSKTRAM